MAEAAVRETNENKNHWRFELLVVKIGTKIIRGLFDNIHKPSILGLILQNRKSTLQGLKDKKIIAAEEWNKLYPTNTTGYGESKEFDLSLLIKLLRNICNLNPSDHWDSPDDDDLSLEADLARLKEHRNKTLAHKANMELSDDDFNQYWQQIQDALLRIRKHYYPADVDDWRREIERLKRTQRNSDADNKAVVNYFPERVIEVTEKLTNSVDVVRRKPIEVQGNKFQAHLSKIAYKEEIDQVLQHMKEDRRYKGATNIVWAYKYYDDDIGRFIYDSVDDEELLAGRRLQHLLEKISVKNVLMIVTYWQGEVYLYLDICKNINERALDLLISRGLCCKGVHQEKVPVILKTLKKEFEIKKRKAAFKAHQAMQQATEEQEANDFEIIHSEVITDRKSTFQAHLAAVTSKNQVDKVLAQLKKESKIAKATYNMYAYRIYVNEKKSYLEDGCDDGENRAGKRILHLLETTKVENAVVIVTRWHGGIHIGAERFKHINACAVDVIKMARERGLIGS